MSYTYTIRTEPFGDVDIEADNIKLARKRARSMFPNGNYPVTRAIPRARRRCLCCDSAPCCCVRPGGGQ